MVMPRIPRPPQLTLIFPFTLFILSPLAYLASQFESLLKFKRSLVDNLGALEYWTPGSEPCSKSVPWAGLICYNGVIMGLHIRGTGLSGKIDVDALLEIKGLRTISLMDNSFLGPIPELSHLGVLKAIFLSRNQFSGKISPDYFSKMGSLKKIWLSNYKFTRKIPSSEAQLAHLLELHLENNLFIGTIPDISLPTLISLNVSNNKLEGPIRPSLVKFDMSTFAGNAGLCKENLRITCPAAALQPQPTNGTNGSTSNNGQNLTGKIIGAMVGVVFAREVVRTRNDIFGPMQSVQKK